MMADRSPGAASAQRFTHLSKLSQSLSHAYLAAARETLHALVADPAVLDNVRLEWQPGTYIRNLLFGDQEMSIWAMVWAPGSATSIHDHRCSCCFGVVKGTITEIWFRVIDAGSAARDSEELRRPGFVAAMLPTGPNIHQMRNDGFEEAISIHIYGFDHRHHATSIGREYLLAGQ